MSDAFLDAKPRRGGCLHKPGCYLASDLQAAYGITTAAKTAGNGVTVAIVDAYGYEGGYAGLARDLNAYLKLNGFSPCATKRCFKVVNEVGGADLPLPGQGANAGWQGETALDLDMVSAACPNCNILLVEAYSAANSDLQTAEATALSMANIVSNSFGSGESVATTPLYDTHPGKVIVASAGDGGAGVLGNPSAPESQPCGFAGVVCVGGTSLHLSNGAYAGETVWQDFNVKINHETANLGATGSGCSAIVPKPSWQTDTGCTMRSAADISANADPITGVIIVCTPCGGSLRAKKMPIMTGIGGTSEAAPLIAGMYGLAGNAATLTNPSQTIWTSSASNFHDVTSGFNDLAGATGLVCTPSIAYICAAGTGYDGPTGWGSPNGLGAL
ncbi:MAG TPA: S8 family serine peptidase [Candidatus Baltobacteraceae bacterium]|nr:S8 family serine peptidase [Candidatus Baltobacteraceae bacterium]